MEIEVLVKIVDGKITLFKRVSGTDVLLEDPIELFAPDNDSLLWSFIGRRLDIVFGENVGGNLNTPFTTNPPTAQGGSAQPEQNGAAQSGVIVYLASFTPPDDPEEAKNLSDEFKYTINLIDLDGTAYTVDPRVRIWRWRRRSDI